MTEENNVVYEEIKEVSVGVDIGTMNIICSRSDEKEARVTRNMFLKVDEEDVDLGEMTNLSYIKDEEGQVYIIGNDAFKFCNIFNKPVNRPMEDGLISSKEMDAVDVLALMIKDLIGDPKEEDIWLSYSVPGDPIDQEKDITYHQKVFGRIFSSLGVNHTPVNEASAIIYNECKDTNYSGIGISFGAGMCNISLMYQGMNVIQFSTSRSGDYIDNSVANALGMVPNKVTSTKERKFSLNMNFMEEKNKKTRRVLEFLNHYYDAMINYNVKNIIKKFNDDAEIDVDEELPIVVSGGTTQVEGFIDLFNDVLGRYELPFDISEVRTATNPLTCVSEGLLIKTMADVNSKK